MLLENMQDIWIKGSSNGTKDRSRARDTRTEMRLFKFGETKYDSIVFVEASIYVDHREYDIYLSTLFHRRYYIIYLMGENKCQTFSIFKSKPMWSKQPML